MSPGTSWKSWKGQEKSARTLQSPIFFAYSSSYQSLPSFQPWTLRVQKSKGEARPRILYEPNSRLGFFYVYRMASFKIFIRSLRVRPNLASSGGGLALISGNSINPRSPSTLCTPLVAGKNHPRIGKSSRRLTHSWYPEGSWKIHWWSLGTIQGWSLQHRWTGCLQRYYNRPRQQRKREIWYEGVFIVK